MTVKIKKSTASGRIAAPPSKSMAHRYLICGALSGESLIKGLAFSEDINATLGCLKALGAKIEIKDNTVLIGGIDFNKEITEPLYCSESGSTLRFLIPICLLFDREITLMGTERLFSRSLSVYEEICNAQGISFLKGKDFVTIKGRLKSGKYSVRGDISSQFISGLMLALSLLEEDSVIELCGDVESGSYLNLTIKALADFGVRISKTDEKTIYIKGSQDYKNREITVEGDYSNSAFLEAFNLFGGNVFIEGLSESSAQGDRVYKEIFKNILREYTSVDISDCPDLAPVLMAVAAAKHGGEFLGTRRLKIKESDRGEAMRAELRKFGIEVLCEQNKITVKKSELKSPTVQLFGHNDHRIVMALAVLLSITGGKIKGAEAVAKSYPDFWDNIRALGIEAAIVNEIN